MLKYTEIDKDENGSGCRLQSVQQLSVNIIRQAGLRWATLVFPFLIKHNQTQIC